MNREVRADLIRDDQAWLRPGDFASDLVCDPQITPENGAIVELDKAVYEPDFFIIHAVMERAAGSLSIDVDGA